MTENPRLGAQSLDQTQPESQTFIWEQNSSHIPQDGHVPQSSQEKWEMSETSGMCPRSSYSARDTVLAYLATHATHEPVSRLKMVQDLPSISAKTIDRHIAVLAGERRVHREYHGRLLMLRFISPQLGAQ